MPKVGSSEGLPIQWVVWFRRHEQATDTAEDVPHGHTGGVAVAKHTVADPTTAVDVAVVDLEGIQGRVGEDISKCVE